MNIRQRKAERHKEALRKLSQEGGNRYCFDCDMRGPLYVVSDFNILVCSGCSAVHRSFQHKVKGITMSEFTEEEIARFTLGGNDVAGKVWLHTFKGKLPRSGDVLALKDFIKDTFVDRRYCAQVAYARLLRSWENPEAALAATESPAPPITTAAAASASTALPPPPAPVETRSPAPGKMSAEPQKSAPPPPPPPAPLNAIDDLFAAPVQAPVMPTAAAVPVATTAPPPPPKVSNLVDDLFTGAPAPALATSAPSSGYTSAQPQPLPGFGGTAYPPQQAPYANNYNSNQAFSTGAPQPPQQQQQQFYDFNAPPLQPGYANPQNPYGNFGNLAPYSAPMQQQQSQQQYPGYNGAFGAAPMQPQGPFSGYNSVAQPSFPGQQQPPPQPYVVDFSAAPPPHPAHANDPFKTLGDPSVFSHLGEPSSGAVSSHPTPSQNPLPHPANPWDQPTPAQTQAFTWGGPVPQPQQQQQQQQPPQNGYTGGAPPPSTFANPAGMPQGVAAPGPGQGWGSPASDPSSSPNRSRIVVLSVTKSSQPPSDIPPMWQ